MKLKACYWVPALALLTAAPAWANYSWGKIMVFRPGIQLGIVVLVLLTETLVVRVVVQMPWKTTALAVIAANAVSGGLGYVFLFGDVHFTNPISLLYMAIPSTVIEFLVVNAIVRNASARPSHCAEWTFIGVLAANLLSALVTFGYLYANYGGRQQPILWSDGVRMRCLGSNFRLGSQGYEAELQALCVHNEYVAASLRRVLEHAQPEPFDVAPPWLPWAQMRLAPRYESALPQRLDPQGRGRPMIWTGAPYFVGQRGVLFSDGHFETVSESHFKQLGVRPSPPEVTIPPPRSTR